jgi:hypothetical protein
MTQSAPQAGHYPQVVLLDTGAAFSAWEARCFGVPKGQVRIAPDLLTRTGDYHRPIKTPIKNLRPAIATPARFRKSSASIALRSVDSRFRKTDRDIK